MVAAKKNVPDSQLTFLKMIRKSYLARHFLPIPEPLLSKYSSNLLKGTLTLNGDWQVEVTDGALKEGWEAFVKDNELRENDHLVFRHGGGRNLLVEIYSSDGSAKDSKKRGRGKAPAAALAASDAEEDGGAGSSKKKKSEKLLLGSDNVAEVVQGIVAELGEHADVSFTVTKVPKVASPAGNASSPGRARLRSASTPPAATPAPAAPVVVEDDEDESSPSAGVVAPASTPERRTPGRKRAAAAEAKSSEPAKKKAKTPASGKKTPAPEKAPPKSPEKTPKVTEKTPKASEKTPKASEKTPKASEKKTPKPKATRTPKVKAEKKTPRVSTSRKRKTLSPAKPKEVVAATPEKKQSAAKRTPKSKKAEKSPEEESSAVIKARAYTSGKPSTVLVMKKSNLQPCFYLNVPSDFSKAHMPPGIQEFEMVDEDNRVWTVRWLGSPKNAFSGGWCYFAQDHKLDLGDACVLEVTSGKRVKILIFRANGLPAIPSKPDGAANAATPAKANASTPAKANGSTPAKENATVALHVTRAEIKEVVIQETLEVDENGDGAVVETVDVDEVVAVITEAPAAADAPAALAAAAAAAAEVEVAGEIEAEANNKNNDKEGDVVAPTPPEAVTLDDDEEEDEDYRPEEDGDAGDSDHNNEKD